MSYLAYSIGAYSFTDLRGAISRRQQNLEIINREGVDGSGLRKLGSRGKPFVLTSIQYVASFSAAKTAIDTYLGLVGTTALTVTIAGISQGDYYVLEVIGEDPRQVASVTGNAPGGSTVELRVKWKLLG